MRPGHRFVAGACCSTVLALSYGTVPLQHSVDSIDSVDPVFTLAARTAAFVGVRQNDRDVRFEDRAGRLRGDTRHRN
jgi:hypothetical protein